MLCTILQPSPPTRGEDTELADSPPPPPTKRVDSVRNQTGYGAPDTPKPTLFLPEPHDFVPDGAPDNPPSTPFPTDANTPMPTGISRRMLIHVATGRRALALLAYEALLAAVLVMGRWWVGWLIRTSTMKVGREEGMAAAGPKMRTLD